METESSTVAPELRDRITSRLFDWYRVHKRDLPWRGASPYAVWVSEIMLQQTQVATVIPYFNRFMARFPTVSELAYASLDEVLKFWSGLGYYARARNLHRAAQIVVEQFFGVVPDNIETISVLPGIGRYTAGAILSIAYDVCSPALDANVIRVLSRVFGVRGDPKKADNRALLWSLAEQLVPSISPGEFNQGLMELGALICESSDPKCDRCPLLEQCIAGNSPNPSALPEMPSGRSTVHVTHSSALICNDAAQVLIIQRPLHGLWGGLWEFPRVVCRPPELPEEGAIRAGREVCGVEIEVDRRIAKIRHTVTHHSITLYGFAARPLSPDSIARPLECSNIRWVQTHVLDEFPFSSPQALLRSAFCATQKY